MHCVARYRRNMAAHLGDPYWQELVDEYPSSVLAHARRQHRWIRGDWQILLWLFPFVPTRHGIKRNSLPSIARWKIPL